MYILRNRSAKLRKLDTLEFTECYRSVPEISYVQLVNRIELELVVLIERGWLSS